ncbi:MAG: 2TM domain-containing protein [Saprospiraceae bacterium]|nr:2TM domain-containing protein [Saprospiraceae bacterium]
MKNENIYTKAGKKVKAKKRFFFHFFTYACILGLLYAISYFEDDGNPLPTIIVALSWGIAIVTHYFKVFGTEHLGFLGISPNWEEEELEHEIEKLKRKRELKENIIKERNLLDDLEKLELREMANRPLDDDYQA